MVACLGIMTGRVHCNDLSLPTKNILSEVNTASPVFIQHKDMHGDINTIYHVNMLYLLDRVFLRDNVGFLSNEQTKFMEEFFKQAHIVTESLNLQPNKGAYVDMTEPMYRLDGFLGDFIGVNDGQFAR